MADINAQIQVNIDTSNALSSLKVLQGQISAFQTQMAQSGAAAQAEARKLQQTLINNINGTGKFSAELKNVASEAEAFTTALEKNKMSIGQYFRFAGAASKDFGRFFGKEFDTINKVAVERVKDIQTQYIQLGKTANGAIKTIAVRPLALDMDNLSTKMQIAAQRQALMNQLLKQGSTAMLNWGKNTQWAGRQLMVGFTIPLAIAGSKAIQSFMDMEKAAIKFKRVYGDAFTSNADTNKALDQVKALAQEFTKYGVAVKDTMDMAATAAATGKMGADLIAQVREANKLSVLGDIDQQKALQTTISLTNAFGISAQDLGKKINFLNATENQTVTSIDDLTTAIPKAAPVIKQLGGNVEDLSFFLTAMKEGGINASEGANALKSGLAAMINPTGKAATMLQGFGINLKGIVEANKGNVKGLVIDFAKALDKLDPLNRARAIEQLFGKFQFSRISTLFKNVIDQGSQANKVLELSKASNEELAVLSEREMKKISDSPMFKFQKALQDIQVKLAPIGEKFLKLLTPIVTWVGKLLDKFNGFDEGTQNFAISFAAIIGGLGPIVLMTTGLIANGIANIIKMIAGIKNFVNTRGVTQDLGMQTQYLTQKEIEAHAAASSLDQVHGKLTQTLTSQAEALQRLAAAYQSVIAKQSQYMYGGGTKPRRKMAGGGMVVGPGGPTDDLVPTDLSNGEAVIDAATVKKNPRIISALFAGRKINIPGYAGNNKGQFAEYIYNPNDRLAETHLQAASPLSANAEGYNPQLVSSMMAARPQLANVSSAIEGNISILGQLIAMLPNKLNENLKRPLGVSVQQFEAAWEGTSDKLTKTVEFGLKQLGYAFDPNNPEIAAEITQIETQIKAETARLANQQVGDLKGRVNDEILTQATSNVLANDNTKAGQALRAAAVTGREHRTNFSQEDLRSKVLSGILSLEETSTGTPKIIDPASGIQVGRGRDLKNMSREEQMATYKSLSGQERSDFVQNTLAMRQESKFVGAKLQKEQFLESENQRIVPQQDAKQDAQTYEKTLDSELNKPQNDPYMIARDRNSPHRLTGQDGVNDAHSYIQSFDSGMSKTNKLAPPPGMSATVPTMTTDVTNNLADTTKTSFFSGIKDKASAMAQKASAVAGTIGTNLGESALNAFEKSSLAKGIAKKLSIPGQVITGRNGNIIYASDENGNDITAQGQQQQMAGTLQPGGVIITSPREYQMDENGSPIFGSRAEKRQFEAEQKQAQKAEKRAAFKEGLKGRFGGGMGMMGANMAIGALATQQGKLGDVARQVIGPFSALSSIMMILPGQLGVVVAALAAVGYLAYNYFQSLENAKKEGMAYAKTLSMTQDKLKKISELYGTVSATEAKAKRSEIAVQNLSKKEQSDAAAFANSEVGKSMISGVATMVKTGMSAASITENLSSQLKLAIAEGVINDKQAAAIGEALGNKVSKSVGLSLAASMSRLDFGKTFKEKTVETGKAMLNQNYETRFKQINSLLESTAKNQIASKSYALQTLATIPVGGLIPQFLAQTLPDDWAKGIGLNNFSAYKEKQTDLAAQKSMAAAGALALGSLETNQQIYDSVQAQLEKKYESLKADYESEKSAKRRKQLEQDIINVQNARLKSQKDFEDANKKSFKTLGDLQKSISADNFNKIVDQSITDMKDKADLVGKAQIEAAQQNISELKGKSAGLANIFNIGLASGQMGAESVAGLSKLASGLDKTAQKKLKLSIETAGLQNVDQMYSLLTAMNAKDSTINLAINTMATDPNMLSNIQSLQQLVVDSGGKISIDINTIVSDPNKLKTIQQINALPKKVTKTQALQVVTDEQYKGNLNKDNIKYLLDSNGTISRSMMLAIEATTMDQMVTDYLKSKGLQGGTGTLTPKERENLKKKALQWWIAQHDYLNQLDKQDPGSGGNSPATNKAKAYTSAIDAQIKVLQKKVDALKKVNDELKKQEDFELAQMRRLNDMKQAMISGDYLKAALIKQEMSMSQAQYDRDKEIKKLEDQIAALQAKKDNAGKTGAKTKADAQKAINDVTIQTNIVLPHMVTPGAATGGLLRGPGSGTSDSMFGMLKYASGGQIPIRLSNGEYITRASSVGKYGLGLMNSINNGTYSPGSSDSVYNVNMTINGGNAKAEDIAKMVIKELNTVASKNRTSNRVNI